MATFLYDLGRNAYLTKLLDWETDDVRPCLVDHADYTPAQDTDEFLQDIGAPARVAVGGASIANKDATAGVADGDDYVLSTVSGDEFEAIVLYLHTGSDATGRLICHIDNYTGLPGTPNGGDITIAWPNDSNKIFKL
jgi:hypothetical protein